VKSLKKKSTESKVVAMNSKSPGLSPKSILVWVGLFAVIGVITLLAAHAAPSTSVTVVPAATNGVSGGKDSTCSFQKAATPTHVAFCESFATASSNDPRVNRSGDLDNKLWGVSRTNTSTNTSQGEYNIWNPASVLGCGADTTLVLPTKDVRVCNGRLYEGVTDGGGQSTLAIYPKQPFDISGGRTGTVSFDVSADSQGPHAAWPEFWWTDQPVPAPVDHRSAQVAHPRNGIGIHFAVGCQPNGYGTIQGVDTISVTRNYVLQEYGTGDYGGNCDFKVGHATGDLNHVEIRISVGEIQVWVSDPTNTPATAALHLVADLKNANITMTKGLTWMLDAHYNGNKFDTQGTHTFAWDNFGFDGPDTYRDLAFDVPDSTAKTATGAGNLGYELKKSENLSLPVNGVYRLQTPTGGLVTFNFFPWDNTVPSFRVSNSAGSGPWHDTVWPFDSETYAWRTLGVAIPASEIQDGTNTLEFKNNTVNGFDSEVVANVDLILVAGSPVPGQTVASTPPPSPAPTPTPIPTPTPTPTPGIGAAFAMQTPTVERGYTHVSISVKTSVATTVRILYGLHGQKLSFITPATSSAATTNTVALDPKLLGPGLHYDFQVVATNATGQVVESALSSFATKGFRLRLIVKDKRGNLFRNHSVTLHSDPQTGTTDNDGVVTFDDVTPGQHEVIVAEAGRTYTQAVAVEDTSGTADSTVATGVAGAAAATSAAAKQAGALQTFALTVPATIVTASAKSSSPSGYLVAAIIVVMAFLGAIAIFVRSRGQHPPVFAGTGSGSATPPPTMPMSGGNATSTVPVEHDFTGVAIPQSPAPSTVIHPTSAPSNPEQGDQTGDQRHL
jgi:hypothetical protein